MAEWLNRQNRIQYKFDNKMTWKTYVYPNVILGLLYFVFDVIFLSSDVAVLSPFFQDNCKNALELEKWIGINLFMYAGISKEVFSFVFF